MLENLYKYTTADDKAIEKLIADENVNVNHFVFNKDQGLPEHFSNSNVYMIVIRGTLSLKLDDQETHLYVKGDMLNIPFNVKMNVGNKHDDVLEMFVIKSPAPQNYK